MTDSHIHIGQFYDTYYEPLEVADVVMSAGMDGFSFSTTSSCIDDIQYDYIEKEISKMLKSIPYSPETILPYFWFIPDYIKQGVSIEKAVETIPYKGIKIHPYTQNWDFDNRKHLDALDSLFDYAKINVLPVLVHTGHSGVDSADRFECFFGEYKSVKFTLAHCRPLDITIKMLGQYPNVCCDTAFVEEDSVRRITKEGFASRIVLGSDFPITHYFRTKYPKDGETPEIPLKEKYREDINQMRLYKGIIQETLPA
jgi:predicted TIM-barrel fold metal-dependent hydrolase